MSAIPKRVQEALIASGDLTPDRIGARPQRRACPTCRAPCLVAIPARHAGVVAWLDPAPTTCYGELTAATTGRSTFLVFRDEIEKRFAEDISEINADIAKSVHAEHSCTAPPLPVHPEYKSVDVTTYPKNPPF